MVGWKGVAIRIVVATIVRVATIRGIEDGIILGLVVVLGNFNSVCHLTLLFLGLVAIEAWAVSISVMAI